MKIAIAGNNPRDQFQDLYMPEENATIPTESTAEGGQQQQATPPNTPDPLNIDYTQLPKEMVKEDVSGLLSTLEKFKKTIKELSPQAKMFQELQKQGVDPEAVPLKLAQLVEEQKRAEEFAQKQTELEARYKREKEEFEQQYNQHVSGMARFIKEQSKNDTLDKVFSRGGGDGADSEASDLFRYAASKYLEIEYEQELANDGRTPIGYKAKIAKVKKPDGTPYFISDGETSRPATPDDFLIAVKKGMYGAYLQTMLPAFNQSQGAGLPAMGGQSANGEVMVSSDPKAMANQMVNMSAEQLRAIRQGKVKQI